MTASKTTFPDTITVDHEEIWRIETVSIRTGLAPNTITEKVRAGTFPPPRQLGDRAVGWLMTEVRAWMRSLPKAGTKAGTSSKRPEKTGSGAAA